MKPRRAQRGLALVAVLWMVAALSLLAAGLASVSRAELRSTQYESVLARTAALGDAAIQLAMLALATAPAEDVRYSRLHFTFDDAEIDVLMQSAAGLVNLNNADEALLADLLHFGGGLDAVHARVLAQRIIDWRDEDEDVLGDGAEADQYLAAGVPFRPRNGPFAVPEDLLQVLGFDLDLFDKIRGFVTVVGGSGAGDVDPLAAAPGLLAVLAQGDVALAADIAARRDGGDFTVDTTRLQHAGVGGGAHSGVYKVQAFLAQPDGRVGLRVRWASLAATESGEPWAVHAVEAARLLAP